MLISENPKIGRRTQEMLKLVPLDKEKNEESKVEDLLSPSKRIFLPHLVYFCQYFHEI